MNTFGQIIFIMWRESVEAMLVVGILHAWLVHQSASRRGLFYLWGGVLAGCVSALLLGLGIEAMNSVLSDENQAYFQTAVLLIAAALIVQMVFWMRRHGRTLKRDMQQSLSGHLENEHWWGVFSLAAIAVAREGSELVIFLSGLAIGHGFASAQFGLALLLGALLAAGTFYALQLGSRWISWRVFFRMTEILLLFLGCSLLVSGMEKLADLQFLSALQSHVWNTSALLDDSSTFGGLVSTFTGYRAWPTLMNILVFAGYWIFILWKMRLPSRLASK